MEPAYSQTPLTRGYLHRRPQIRMPKPLALPQHRLPLLPRQRVGKAIAEVQVDRVVRLSLLARTGFTASSDCGLAFSRSNSFLTAM